MSVAERVEAWRASEPVSCTAAEFAAARSRLRNCKFDALTALLSDAGVVFRSGRLNPTHNVFSRICSRVTVDERAKAMNAPLSSTPFVAAYNRPACDDNWESSEAEWVGRASMARRHRLLLLDSPDWTFFNALTFGMPTDATDYDAIRAAITMLESMRAAALALVAHEGDWPPDKVGLYFHVFPYNSVQSLHLHVVDLGATGPTFAALAYKNLLLDDVLKVLRDELAGSAIEAPLALELLPRAPPLSGLIVPDPILPPPPASTTEPVGLAALAAASSSTSPTFPQLPPQLPQLPPPPTKMRGSPSSALALALGGGSDSVGALALARALGYDHIILVQPGSTTRGAVACQRVAAAPSIIGPPGGHFHSDDSMLAYLLSMPLGLGPATAYYMHQPKDAADGDGFTRGAFEATVSALGALMREHGCSAAVGLDFGGDVALPERPDRVASDTFSQRDRLNLQALAAVARELAIGVTLVAAAPGVDAAAVSPEYARQLAALDENATPVLMMGADGLHPCALMPVPGRAPVCSLAALPEALCKTRLPTALESQFIGELRRISSRISFDARPEVQREHSYKTCAIAVVCSRSPSACLLHEDMRNTLGAHTDRCLACPPPSWSFLDRLK